MVEDQEAWKGKRCSSYADPHQTTFDGLYDKLNYHPLTVLLIVHSRLIITNTIDRKSALN